MPQRHTLVHQRVDADRQQARKQTHQLADHAQPDAGHRVMQAIGVAAAGQADHQLQRDRA
jgi:hypothetical protein